MSFRILSTNRDAGPGDLSPEPAPESVTDPVRQSLAAGIRYLARAQHPQGSWTDFWLPVGTSDAWVSAYVGLSLELASRVEWLDEGSRKLAAECARRAGEWLLAEPRPLRGWGYNARVSPDADTTAHALSLLARLGYETPVDAIEFLKSHEAGTGFATYRFQDPQHQWTKPCVDVSAACLRCLHDLGLLSGEALRRRWCESVGAQQDEDGLWRGYWWFSPNYATALVLEVWQLAGRPSLPKLSHVANAADMGGEPHPMRSIVCRALPVGNAFDLANAVLAMVYSLPVEVWTSAGAWAEAEARAEAKVRTEAEALRSVMLERTSMLVSMQSGDGGWPTAPILRVPPSHPGPGARREPLAARDARRLFTTATAVKALATFLSVAAPAAVSMPGGGRSRFRIRSQHPSLKGPGLKAHKESQAHALRNLVERAAAAVGLDAFECKRAGEIFAALTVHSLAEPSPWPSEQLSVLSVGSPLEFSVTAGTVRRPALRYAVEVGAPYLAPYDRAVSALEAIKEVARRLGYTSAWKRVAPSFACLVSPHMLVPDGLRFWVWAGVDHVSGAGHEGGLPVLKVYIGLLHREVPGSWERLAAALEGAGIRTAPASAAALDLLNEAGFVHELGFGIGPGGRIACKIYYEMDGWRRTLAERILALAGLPQDASALCPEIPGVLTEHLAAKSRSGIALRLDPDSGSVKDVTSASAFPVPMLTPEETCRRVSAWIESQGWDGGEYRRLCELMVQTWAEHEPPFPRVHSLVTRTRSKQESWATIYLRPHVPPDPSASVH